MQPDEEVEETFNGKQNILKRPLNFSVLWRWTLELKVRLKMDAKRSIRMQAKHEKNLTNRPFLT